MISKKKITTKQMRFLLATAKDHLHKAHTDSKPHFHRMMSGKLDLKSGGGPVKPEKSDVKLKFAKPSAKRAK